MTDYADLVAQARRYADKKDATRDGASAIGTELLRLQADAIETLVRERDEANARSESRGKILLRTRNKLINIKDAVESDDDRAFFGSTNDADEFFTVVEALDDFKWDRIMREGKEGTPLKDAVVRAEAAEAEVARLREALKEILENSKFRSDMVGHIARAALEAK